MKAFHAYRDILFIHSCSSISIYTLCIKSNLSDEHIHENLSGESGGDVRTLFLTVHQASRTVFDQAGRQLFDAE